MKTTAYLLSTVCGAFLMAAGLSGCGSVLNDDKADNVIMELNTGVADNSTSSKADDNTVVSPVPGDVYLWPETSTNNYSLDNPQYTYKIADLTAWSTTKYTEGDPYPTDGIAMNAVGFSPESGITKNGGTFTISEATKYGMLDVCTSNAVSGTSQTPFSAALTFSHALTRVRFYVKTDDTMKDLWNLTSLTLTIPAKYLANKWEWDNTTKTFSITGMSNVAQSDYFEVNGVSTFGDYLHMFDNYLMLNTTNALNGLLTGIKLSIERHSAANNAQFPDPVVQKISWDLDSELSTQGIQLYKENNTDKETEPQAGYSYQIYFIFSNNTFTLKAYREPWKLGGLITIPVQP